MGGRPGLRCEYVQRRATSRRCQRSNVSGRTENTFQLRRGRCRLSAASSTRSRSSNRGCPTCRRRTDSSCRSTRISNSFARSRRPSSTTNSSTRQTTMYKAETSKGDLQQTGTPTLPPAQQPSCLSRSGFCTPRVECAVRPVLVVMPAVDAKGRKALPLQIVDDDISDRRLVVDDQDRLHAPILPASPYRTLKSARGRAAGVIDI